jgi:hypothetical protein
VDVEVEHPHVHHRSGHRLLDLALPIAALFVSLVSIGIAYHHGHIMQGLVEQNERLVQANSLPRLQLYGSNRAEQGVRSVTFEVANQGVGPAEIRSMQILVDGKPVSSLREMIRRCCGPGNYSGLGQTTLWGTMIRPGERLAYISLPPAAQTQQAAAALDSARRTDRIETRLCYCSVFDECWNVSSAGTPRPRPVAQCSVAEPQFRE